MAQSSEGPAKCKWSLSNPGQKSPHNVIQPQKFEGIMDSVLDNIGFFYCPIHKLLLTR